MPSKAKKFGCKKPGGRPMSPESIKKWTAKGGSVCDGVVSKGGKTPGESPGKFRDLKEGSKAHTAREKRYSKMKALRDKARAAKMKEKKGKDRDALQKSREDYKKNWSRKKVEDKPKSEPISEGPITEDEERWYNSYTHFPNEKGYWNEDWRNYRDNLEKETKEGLGGGEIPENIEKLIDVAHERYGEFLKARVRAQIDAPPAYVVGPAGYKNYEKKQERAQNKVSKASGRVKDIEKKIESKIGGILNNNISSDDSEAEKKLIDRIEKSKGIADYAAKYSRKISRAKTEDAFVKAVENSDMRQELKDELFKTQKSIGWNWARQQLSFRGQKYRRKVKEDERRLEGIRQTKGQDHKESGFEQHGGGKIIHNPGVNRLQIEFKEKPDVETRAKLKKRGFRWSPKNKTWQRHLTKHAQWDAEKALGIRE